MSLAAVLCRHRTGIILLVGNLCEELVSTVTVLNVHETVGIQRAGTTTGSTCNIRFETVRLGPDFDEPLLAAASMDVHSGRGEGVRYTEHCPPYGFS